MPTTPTTDDVLEERVWEKFAAEAKRRGAIWDLPDDEVAGWAPLRDALKPDPAAPPIPPEKQFPREQWITWPNRRRIALLLCERALDGPEPLDDQRWWQVSFLMQYGGKERI